MHLLWNRLKYVMSPQFDIYAMLADHVTGKVADVGFGTGFGSHLLLANAAEVYGFDVDEDAVRFARSAFPFKNLHFEAGDIALGIPGQFDFVLMIDVIEHIKDDTAALRNALKMLVPGGAFICSTPNAMSRYRKADTHVREYTPKELARILGQVFKSVELRNHAFDILSKYDNPIVALCRNVG